MSGNEKRYFETTIQCLANTFVIGLVSDCYILHSNELSGTRSAYAWERKQGKTHAKFFDISAGPSAMVTRDSQ